MMGSLLGPSQQSTGRKSALNIKLLQDDLFTWVNKSLPLPETEFGNYFILKKSVEM